MIRNVRLGTPPLLALLLAVACIRPPHGPSGDDGYATSDCRSIAALLGRGRGPSPRMAPPMWRVRACPVRAGELLATLLHSVRGVSDTTALDEATWLTQYVHDGRLVATGIDVATDSLAVPDARIAALRVLLWSKAPGHYMPLRSMVVPPSCHPRSCYSSYTGHFFGGGPIVGDTIGWPVFGAPMPANYVARIDSIALLLEHGPTTPERVRRAARVVHSYPRDRELQGR